MLRAVALALSLAISPVAFAQISPLGNAHLELSVVGLPIYSSDGLRIGDVTMLGTYRGETAMIGEVSRSMGLGTRSVLIPEAMATVAAGRVVLSITSDEVEARLEPAH